MGALTTDITQGVLCLWMTLCFLSVGSSGKGLHGIGLREQNDDNIRKTTNCQELETCSPGGKDGLGRRGGQGTTEPVCGSNGKTYQSLCHFHHAACLDKRLKYKHQGGCTLQEQCPDQRRTAQDDSKRLEGIWVPICNEDGTFARVQCHELTGYCWCTLADGKPDGTDATLKHKPNCTDTNRKDDIRYTDSGDVNTRTSGTGGAEGCSGKTRKEFTKNMVKLIVKDFVREGGYSKDKMTSKSKNTQALEWKFHGLERKTDQILTRREYKGLKKFVQNSIKPKKCAGSFPKFCDIDKDNKITLKEWVECFTISGTDKRTRKKGRKMHEITNRVNIKKRQPQCEKERQAAQEQSNGANDTQFKPECDKKGHYIPVQCYGSSDRTLWYCFCVDILTGTMIPNSSVAINNGRPDCLKITAPPKPWDSCKKVPEFLAGLMIYLKKITENEGSYNGIQGERLNEADRVRIGEKFFNRIDKNKNGKIEKSEKKQIRKQLKLKKHKHLRQCGRRLHVVCDANNDKVITLPEWLECIQAQVPESGSSSKYDSSNSQSKDDAANPFIHILKPID